MKFSVQAVSKEASWSAGNGGIADDNWIKNKDVFARVSINGDVYTLESFRTGP